MAKQMRKIKAEKFLNKDKEKRMTKMWKDTLIADKMRKMIMRMKF